MASSIDDTISIKIINEQKMKNEIQFPLVLHLERYAIANGNGEKSHTVDFTSITTNSIDNLANGISLNLIKVTEHKYPLRLQLKGSDAKKNTCLSTNNIRLTRDGLIDTKKPFNLNTFYIKFDWKKTTSNDDDDDEVNIL